MDVRKKKIFSLVALLDASAGNYHRLKSSREVNVGAHMAAVGLFISSDVQIHKIQICLIPSVC